MHAITTCSRVQKVTLTSSNCINVPGTRLSIYVSTPAGARYQLMRYSRKDRYTYTSTVPATRLVYHTRYYTIAHSKEDFLHLICAASISCDSGSSEIAWFSTSTWHQVGTMNPGTHQLHAAEAAQWYFLRTANETLRTTK